MDGEEKFYLPVFLNDDKWTSALSDAERGSLLRATLRAVKGESIPDDLTPSVRALLPIYLDTAEKSIRMQRERHKNAMNAAQASVEARKERQAGANGRKRALTGAGPGQPEGEEVGEEEGEREEGIEKGKFFDEEDLLRLVPDYAQEAFSDVLAWIRQGGDWAAAFGGKGRALARLFVLFPTEEVLGALRDTLERWRGGEVTNAVAYVRAICEARCADA